MNQKRVQMNKRGSVTLLVIIIAVVLALSSTVYYASKSDSLTGTLVGIETISGACNITIRESILNIGHDYECQNTDGFQIAANNIIFDCQNHYIKCVSGCNSTTGEVGIRLSGRSNVTIKNCYIYNFTDGIRIDQNSHDNILLTNFFYNNTDGVDINNATGNNLTQNTFDYNVQCSVNISNMNNNIATTSTYNNIWNNLFNNTKTGFEACNDVGSYNHWNLDKTCPSTTYNSTHTYSQAGISTTNVRGGQCLGGNWWENYTGIDNTGDGLGDTLTPYYGGKILQTGIGDSYPLVDSCTRLPGLICEPTTCGAKTITSTSGEGYSIICNNAILTCNGTALRALNVTSGREDMRGIEIKNVHDVTVIGCEIYNFTYGIYIENSYNIKLINITVHDNNNTGIYIGSLAYNVTVNSSRIGNLNNNGMNYSQRYGIHFLSSKPSGGNSFIYLNTIHNNSLAGIYLSDTSASNTIHSNTIYGNYDGILVNSSNGNNIYNNTIYNNTNAGIKAISSTLSNLGTGSSKNIISRNTYGYLLDTASSDNANGITGTLYNNTYGVYFTNSNPDLSSLKINNSNYGIYLDGGSNINVNNVNLTFNTISFYAANNTNLVFSDTSDVYIYNNTYGLYLFNTNRSSFEPLSGLTILNIYNNNYNIILENSSSNIFNSLTIFGGAVGFNLTRSSNNTIKNSIISNFSSYNFNLNLSSNNNTIYNNYIGNLSTGGGALAYDNGTNYWNTSSQAGTNIFGYANIGGNYWAGFATNDTNSDGFGDIPNSYNITGGNNRDYLPLTTPLFLCSNISTSYTYTQNISANGSCIIVTGDNITLNFAGFYLIGNSSGVGINITGRQGVKIINANILNFSTAIASVRSTALNLNYTNISSNNIALALTTTNTSLIFSGIFFNNSYGITLTSSFNNTISNISNISNNLQGITLTNSNNNIIYTNRLINNPLGLSLTTSSNNLIYNNYFNNTINAQDDGSTNKWNTSYLQFGGNILGGEKNSTGGNFWSDYIGKDFGGGSDPYNNSNDGIGDTAIPYTGTGLITGGDYLPLTLSTTSDTTSCQSIGTDTILTGSISCSGSNGVTISANNVNLNCNNYQISGDGTGAGISIEGKQNIIIKNCNITNFYYGIKLLNTKNVQIIPNNNIFSNNFYGIYLYQTNETKIESNTITNDNNGVYSISSRNTTINNNFINLQKKFYGIYLYSSPINTINNNTLWQNYHGIYLVDSSNTNASNNNVTISDVYSVFINKNTLTAHFLNNKLSLGSEGIRIKTDSDSNYFFNNTISDHSSYGLDSSDADSNIYINNTITNNSVNVYLSNSASNTFTGNNVSNSPTGFQAVSGSNSLTLTSNIINSTNSPALSLSSSSSPNLQGNKIYNDAILTSTSSASLTQNNTINPYLNITHSNTLTISNNTLQYIYIINTSGSSFNRNTLTQLNAQNFTLGNIFSNTIANNNLVACNLQTVSSSNIYSNDIQNTSTAILLTSSSSSNNIYTNWLKNNALGLNLSDSGSTGNKIYNNYFSNTNNVVDTISGNKWNTTLSCSSANIVGGPCQGGNFYSNYYGLDNGANSRDQGDGIGDQPANFTINANSGINAYDYLPLVLYVARQYFQPSSASDSLADSMTAIANTSGTLSDGEVVPNEVQLINYTSSGNTYLEITALFNQSNINTSNLKINFNNNKTAVNKTGVSNLGNYYNLYLYHNYGFDTGVYLCPETYNLSLANTSCPYRIIFNTTSYTNGITFSQVGNYYKLSNISNNSMSIVLNKDDYCGKNIFHNVTLSGNLSCALGINEPALNIIVDNLTIDFAGYALIGNGTGIGLNISRRVGVTIKNANILNFSTAIYINPSTNITITNCNLSNSSVGLALFGTNYSLITNNRIINNSIGLNLSFSYNNSIYNNYFGNANNSVDNGNNFWNTTSSCSASTTNIIGGNCTGGNYWSDYSGWDIDFNGVGSTLIPYNNSHSIAGTAFGGDYLPFTDFGKIACGGTTQNVSNNITLNRNLIATGNCFTLAATSANNVIIDCQNYLITGNLGGSAVFAEDKLGLTVQNCQLFNFTQGIYLNNTNQSLIISNTIYNNTYGAYTFNGNYDNLTSNTIYYNTYGTYFSNGNYNNIISNTIYNNGNGSYLIFGNNTLLRLNKIYANTLAGIYLENSTLSNLTINIFNNTPTAALLIYSHYNYFNNNTFKNNTWALNLTSSWNNTIFNNYFNNTNNAWDRGSNNYWNSTYACAASTKNILGGNCTGGNYWGNYNGSDNGLGTGAFNTTPWNISGNGIGDTLLPYNNSHNLTLGDYLPLLAICGNGVKEENEACDTTEFGGQTCASYGYLYGSLSCSGCAISTSGCTNISSSSSSSSSSGGGGGGSGSSSSVVVTALPNCTQSWTCGGWSDCLGERQTRNCNDANDCINKKAAGKVDQIITITKPLETRSCVMPVQPEVAPRPLPPPSPKKAPLLEKVKAALPEVVQKPSPARTITLSSVAAVALFGGIYALWQFTSTTNRLRRRMKKLAPLLNEESSEVLKENYLGIYNLYLKLSESHKQNFYSKVTKLRETIETQLKAEKKIEELFQKVTTCQTLLEQKKIYLDIYNNYQKLPGKMQSKYYAQIVNLREQLETGRWSRKSGTETEEGSE